MNILKYKLTMICSVLLALAGFGGQASAQTLFSDDFEDRVKDQALIGPGAIGGPGWTWYNQTYSDDLCTEYSSGFGPFDDNDGGIDYLQENRNYWTSDAAVGQGDSYFRAGLEVPAWAMDSSSGLGAWARPQTNTPSVAKSLGRSLTCASAKKPSAF
jgi:hypothetical protein